MSIANELQRIVNAKKELAGKIAEMGLKYYDDDAKSYVAVSVDDNGDTNDTIDELAEALETLEVSKPTNHLDNVIVSVDPLTGLITTQVLFPTNTVFKEEDYDWVKANAEEQLDVYEGGTITPTETVQHVVSHATYLTGSIYVDPIPANYVNTDGITKDSDDVTVDGPVITIPAGYYPNEATKSVPRMAVLQEMLNPLDEPVGTDEGGYALLIKTDVDRYVEELWIGIDPSFEEALAAI